MKILIAYDGSEHAKAAIRDLRRSGIASQATALITTVGDAPMPPIGAPSLDPSIARRPDSLLAHDRSEIALSLEHAEEVAKEGASLVAEACSGSNITTHVQLGRPADVIISRADTFGADLIVVGAQGRGALGRLLLGSVSQHVATKAARSVLVARHVVDRGDNPVRIVVGIDGSPASYAAVDAVAKRSWRHDSEVRIVAIAGTYRATSVARRIPTAAAWIDETNQSQRSAAQAALEHSLSAFGTTSLRVSQHFAEGGVQQVLNEHAAECDADCIFVSGSGFSADLPHGTADAINALVTSAPCSVEIVRQAGDYLPSE